MRLFQKARKITKKNAHVQIFVRFFAKLCLIYRIALVMVSLTSR